MKRNILLVSIPLLLLSSCQGGGNGAEEPKFTFKNVPYFQAHSSLIGEDKCIDLSKQEASTFPLAFLPGQPYMPYVKVSDYVKAFNSKASFIEGEQDDGKTYLINFARKENKFSFCFDSMNKQMIISGDYESLLQEGVYTDYSSNAIEAKVTNGSIGNLNAPYALSYGQTELSALSYGKETYAPLALLDSVFFKMLSIGTFFAYDRLYQYSDPSTFNKLKFIDKKGDTPYTIPEGMARLIEEEEMPMYLRRYNRDIITFVLDNYYGLKYALDIKSVADYLKSTTYYDDLISENPTVRANAIFNLFQRFNDGHSAVVPVTTAWGESSSKDIPQSIIDTRETIENALGASRAAVYKELGLKETDVRYSKDGTAAVFTLRKFENYENYFDQKTGKPTVSIEEAMKEDTYLQSKAHFEEIDKKGGVKTIIIDMSINDGGSSATMGSLLTLLSKDNKSMIYLQDIHTNAVNTVETRLDTNRDGKIDSQDVTYGKYDIYLLVSPAAFSCGTAYPFFADKQEFAKVIGQKPGGGECVLGQALFPSGQACYHSSTMRVCYPEKDGYDYDEGGVTLYETFDYNEFYDLEKMLTKLKEGE